MNLNQTPRKLLGELATHYYDNALLLFEEHYVSFCIPFMRIPQPNSLLARIFGISKIRPQDMVSLFSESSSASKDPRCIFHQLRPVSGLENLGAWPSHAIKTQWLIQTLCLKKAFSYRCGDSARLGSASRLTPVANRHQSTINRSIVQECKLHFNLWDGN